MKQNDGELLPVIRSVGCYFLSLGRIIELEAGIEFTAEQYNAVWKRSEEKKYIVSKDIKKPDHIMKEFAYEAKKMAISICQVGQELDEKTTFWGWVTPVYKNYKYVVEMRKTNGVVGTHFVLCDKDKNLIYDSYDFHDYEWKPSGRYIFYTKI
mgnify:CR=1 FL=1